MSDPNTPIKHSRIYHFEDDSNILQFSEILNYQQKTELRSQKSFLVGKSELTYFNVINTELIIFHPKKAKLDHNAKC